MSASLSGRAGGVLGDGHSLKFPAGPRESSGMAAKWLLGGERSPDCPIGGMPGPAGA